jgi:hypothetical protein
MSSSKSKSLIAIICLLNLVLFAGFGTAQDVPYGTGTWDNDKLGNHRIVIMMKGDDEAEYVKLPWRRRDQNPQDKDVIFTDAKGTRIDNVVRLDVNREYGTFIIEPISGQGRYYAYYLPNIMHGRSNYPKVTYAKPESKAAASWLKENNLHKINLLAQEVEKLANAEVVEIQAIDELNSFYPMEVIATKVEKAKLQKENSSKSYLLFPEDRMYPIKMTEDLPYRWVENGANSSFNGEADKGEYYAFQIGVWAFAAELNDIDFQFAELKNASGAVIPASEMTCFNLMGRDSTGQPMTKNISVEQGKVQPLWLGVQIPEDAVSGTYKGDLTFRVPTKKSTTIAIEIEVTDQKIDAAGDDEPWRHSRLRWLNSDLGMDDRLIAPYTAMRVNENRISLLGRTVALNQIGLPESILSHFSETMTDTNAEGREMLSAPVNLVVEHADKQLAKWQAEGFEITEKKDGAIGWKAAAKAGALSLKLNARMEYEGTVEFKVALTSSEAVEVKDIRLEIPLNSEIAQYMMGMGYMGGKKPLHFQWKWDKKYNQDSIWVGDVNAGIQASFKDKNYDRPLNTNFYHSKPLNMPPSWFNEGKGGCEINLSKDKKSYLIQTFSGERVIEKGEVLNFDFRLMITPFRPIDPKAQFSTRYYHSYKPVDEIKASGANTVNIHHANEINPYINYPFLRPAEMKAYIDEAHSKNMLVKIYYTVRELSNRAPELFALRSLGDEILSYGSGGGFSWLQEHLDQDYIAAWFVPHLKDAAIINSGVSRWHNYYVEGLNWLVKNVGIDGLYIDDVAFDRVTMKRVKNILAQGKNGGMIDLHSANQFNIRDGYTSSANLYMEHFPFIDRLWFGEYFDYDSMPDYWLIEISGIPFGLMGEMLQDGGNPWRGMVFGITARLPWAGDPTALWKVWDDFGIIDSQMIGWWVKDRPIKTGHRDILVTTYQRPEGALIAIASWSNEDEEIKLRIDWKALGFDPSKYVLEAAEIDNFQPAMQFKIDELITIPQGKGWLLNLKQVK